MALLQQQPHTGCPHERSLEESHGPVLQMAALEAQGILVRAVGKVDEKEIQTLVFSNAGEWTKVTACLVPRSSNKGPQTRTVLMALEVGNGPCWSLLRLLS